MDPGVIFEAALAKGVRLINPATIRKTNIDFFIFSPQTLPLVALAL